MGKIDKFKPRLGRGLSSLLAVSEAESATGLPIMMEVAGPDGDADAPPADVVRQVPLDAIVPNPHQPRRVFNDQSIAELAASLKSTGLIQPIIVRQVGEHFQLIAGERRWRAAKLAALPTVPAIVRSVDSATQAQMALVENIHREDLNPIDRAQSYRGLMDQLGLTQAELSGRLGEDRSGIANYLRLLNLIEPVREMVREGRISFGHAKVLAGVEDMLRQQGLADRVLAEGLTVRALEALLQSLTESPAKHPLPAASASAHLRDLEQSLSRQLGMRVQVRPKGKKGGGHLLIHYGSLDQFDDLVGKIGAQIEQS